MSKLLKIAAALTVLFGLTACTVVPAQVGYVGPDVAVVARPAPYYGAPGPYYYGPPRPGYWHGYGGYRRW